MKRKIFKLLILIALPFVFTGCASSNKYDYSDNKVIASEDDKYNTVSYSVSPMTNGSIHGEIKKFDGTRKILESKVSEETETALHISFIASSGKAKLVLVKPNLEVEVIKEVVAEKDNQNYEGDISVLCAAGNNKIKLVGENYGGSFEISQPKEILFKS